MEMLANEPIDLVCPRSMSERWALQAAGQDASGNTQLLVLVSAAALGLAWPRFRVKEDTPRYRYNILEYGAEVQDCLLRAGASFRQIEDWSIKAYKLCTKGLVADPDVKAARAFSAVPGEPPREPHSGSSEPGDKSPDGSEPSSGTPPHS